MFWFLTVLGMHSKMRAEILKLMKSPQSYLIRVGALVIVLGAALALRASAQMVIYQQNFDNPTVGGDIYFTTDPAYNGIIDGSSSNGITTGASLTGNATTTNGALSGNFGGITPQSGPYLLQDGTNGGGPSYTGTVFSSAGTTINTLPNSIYRFSFYLGETNSTNAPSIQASINGAPLGAAITPNLGSLQQYSFTYNSGAATTAILSLFNNTGAGFGNDLAVDSIQFTLVQASLPVAGLTANQAAIANNLTSSLVFSGVSISVFNAYIANPASLGGVLDQLSPEEFSRFTSITAFNNASFETEAMDNYLASQRRGPNGSFAGGNGGIDTSGLTINDPSYDPGLAMVHSRLLAWNPAPAGQAVSDVASPLMGGVDMKDSKEMKSETAPAYTDPWNFFVRGNVILGQGFSQTDVGHFDENTESVILGTDYRITPNFLVGLKAGYGHTDVTLDNNGSSATVDSYSPAFYASYANQGWYANLTGDYLHNAYTEQREISFLGQAANGAPQGNEGVANLDGGYDFHKGAWTFGPIGGIQYTHLSVNGFSEGGSIADLNVEGDDSDSLRSRLGGRASYALSCHGMTFTPHLDATWQHEFMDQGRGITGQFDTTGLGSFTVRTENPQRDFALADAGLDADLNRTVTLFADYAMQAGQDNYFGQSVQAGVKIGF
jgi:uncharacterized protein YhjY with autotransporter beta-barrel domain